MDKAIKKFLITSALGTYFEFFDFALYAATATIFARKFFVGSELYVWIVFWASFIARPLGSIFFGYIGDKYSCKLAMISSLALMCISTTLIGCLPGYGEIGIIAPICLALLRFLQGFAISPEYNGAPVYLSFQKKASKKLGTLCSVNGIATILGIISAGCVISLVTHGYKIDEIPDIRWRMVYIISSMVIGGAGLLLRLSMSEQEDREKCSETFPLLLGLKSQWREMLSCFFVSGYSAAIFYMFFAYLPAFLQNKKGYLIGESLIVINCGAILMAVMLFISACLSDKLGRIRVIKNACLSLVLFFPIFWWSVSSSYQALHYVAVVLISISIGAFIGPLPSLLVEYFYERQRFSSSSVVHNFASAILGGSSPYLVSIISGDLGFQYGIICYFSLIGIFAFFGICNLDKPASYSHRVQALQSI